jgi:hypothetical protein
VPSSVGPDEENHRLESRMREIRSSGSEGGGGGDNRLSLPLSRQAGSLPHKAG